MFDRLEFASFRALNSRKIAIKKPVPALRNASRSTKRCFSHLCSIRHKGRLDEVDSGSVLLAQLQFVQILFKPQLVHLGLL